MRYLILTSLLALGCGEAFSPDFFPPEEDGGVAESETEAPPEEGSSDRDALDAPSETDEAGVCLSRVPSGTSIGASSSRDDLHLPKFAIDDDLSTAWNAGATSAEIWFTLPEPAELSALSLLVEATPDSTATYTVFSLEGGFWFEVGLTEAFITGLPTAVRVPLTQASYQTLRVVIDIGTSAVAAWEIQLEGACP
jgi:hypothetical protein